MDEKLECRNGDWFLVGMLCEIYLIL